jgi:allantoinase
VENVNGDRWIDYDRLIGRPGRCAGLIRLLEHVRSFEDVWFGRGVDVAEHWRDRFPAAPSSS